MPNRIREVLEVCGLRVSNIFARTRVSVLPNIQKVPHSIPTIATNLKSNNKTVSIMSIT